MENKVRKIIIAVDGYSSCGKSTFAKAIAKSLGYIFIDTGAMYRAVTLWAMRNGYLGSEASIVGNIGDVNISFKFNPETEKSDIYLNGENVENEIRGLEVSSNVSAVSKIREVRRKLVSIQQQMGEQRGVVMDGRDIGTVVFPDAEIKLFMTASVEVRADRRYKELVGKGQIVSMEEIRQNIISRDHEDENRKESPLRKAEDAILLDNSHMTPEEQMNWFQRLLVQKGLLF